MSKINSIYQTMQNIQDHICQMVNRYDSQPFKEDIWQRPEGGGGRTRVMHSGSIMEQAGVNFSHVFGHKLPPSASERRPQLAGKSFEATGVSVVLHPHNPYVPTCHFNVRYIQAGSGPDAIWWFGGGFDLTPYYGFTEDCVHWHQMARQACQPFGDNLYSRFKSWCDNYFYLKHRQEHRGIGGLFFDDFNELGFDDSKAFIEQVSAHFIKAYEPILAKRYRHEYGEHERLFQQHRRGRYVEFNLLYDRGTLFGLQSGGRTESILMSLPPSVRWAYQWQPEPGSCEERLTEDFIGAKDWL